MSTATEYGVEELAIDLGCELGLPSCRELVERDFRGTFYEAPAEPLSIRRLEELRFARVVRENANRADRLGYRHAIIDRADWADDLYAIRSSVRVRQGRPMPPAYMNPEAYGSDPLPHECPCPRHMDVVHGVYTADVISSDETLVAYCQIAQCGELARFNTILGHAGYLRQRVVWLLVSEALRWHRDVCGAMFALYYSHDSGHGGGLRYFKERFGFRPAHVEWLNA